MTAVGLMSWSLAVISVAIATGVVVTVFIVVRSLWRDNV
jgi:cytochrome c oxidase subunit IV